MAPNPKVAAAFRAMEFLGISINKVKPVLKRLLKLYDKNWEMIEEENYRVLIDAIFDDDDEKAPEPKKKPRSNEDREEDAQVHEEPERPLKRLRRGQEGQASSSVSNRSPMLGGPSLKRPKVEAEELPAASPAQHSKDMMDSQQPTAGNTRDDSERGTWQITKSRHKQPVSPKPLAIQGGSSPPQPRVYSRSISKRANQAVLPSRKAPNIQALITPKDEPYTDDVPNLEVPIAVIHPEETSRGALLGSQSSGPSSSACVDKRNRGDDVLALSSGTRSNCDLAVVADESPNLEIASSPLGEVKVSLSCNSGASNFRMPSIDAVMKLMEDKCLRSYKIIDPNFSFKNLMEDMCKCVLELGTESSPEPQEKSVDVVPALDQLKKSTAQDALNIGDNLETFCIPANTLNGSPDTNFSVDIIAPQIPRLSPALNCLVDNLQGSNEVLANGCTESNEDNSHSLVVVQQCELTTDALRSLHDINDITRGQEKVNISWINEVNKECPPSFQYIPQNFVFHNARVNFTLYQIEDDNCCPTCIDDCLVLSTPCVCAIETGGEYAYTSEGLIKQSFLEECVSVNHKPQKQDYFYCKECPSEKSKKDDDLESCKGHLRRKFIKECWIKCGCNKQQCGNRVVQRGINCKLQVFMTNDGKGWGLRTLEELPMGAFLCEYVGEILTNVEMYERNMQNTKKRSYPVLLDAGWGSGVIEDEKALCLDSTSFGNAARFINHRCLDANLVEIPVEVENPDHSFYHVALFTTRKIDAMEELTRDYGIDFDDQDHPVKPFKCLCGSKFCRNMKRSNRSRSAR